MNPTFFWAIDGAAHSRKWRNARRCDCRGFPRRAARGFSLLETIAATVLVTLTLVTSLNSMAFVLKTTHHQSHAQQATTIAQILLAEIMAQPFADAVNSSASLGNEADEMSAPRTAWDDCDDYHGWSTPNITDRQGNPLEIARGWAASVRVGYASTTDPEIDSATATPLKKITLSLTAPSQQTFVFVTLRCDKGTLTDPQLPTSAVLAHVDIAAQAENKAVAVGTRIHNQQVAN